MKTTPAPTPAPNPAAHAAATVNAAALEGLSALADGRADALPAACNAWQADAEARQRWHAYQLIGDVLRSEELARPAGHDAAFLCALRERLALEPAVLAPQALPPPPQGLPDSRSSAAGQLSGTRLRDARWLLPAAAAAGVLVVAGVVGMSGMFGSGGVNLPGLQARSSAAPLASGLASSTGAMVRNAELDAQLVDYVRAHNGQRGLAVPVRPGGGLQAVDVPLHGGAAGPGAVRAATAASGSR